jgi:hypothetical protein
VPHSCCEECAGFRLTLFDGALSGNFIYQIRHHDPDRRLWVLRGDKLFLGVTYEPEPAFTEITQDEETILATIFRYDPELIVIEDPPTGLNYVGWQHLLPVAKRLRQALRKHPERFRLETIVPIESNEPHFREVRLLVYRSLLRNEIPERNLEINTLFLRRSVKTVLPSQRVH